MSKVIRKIGNETWKSICNHHHFTTLKWHLMRIQGSINVDTLLCHRLPMLALLHQDNVMPYKLFPHYWPLGRGIPSVSRWKSHWFGAFFVVDMTIKWPVIWVHFLSLARSKLRLCSANHRLGYWCNLLCDWTGTAWAYSEQETENGPWYAMALMWQYCNAYLPQLSASVKSLSVMSKGTKSELNARQIYAEIGTYRGTTVALRKVHKDIVTFNKEDLREMNTVRSLWRWFYHYHCYLKTSFYRYHPLNSIYDIYRFWEYWILAKWDSPMPCLSFYHISNARW